MASDSASTGLEPWETALIESFVRAAGLIGLPRSIGEIYGLLYCASEALTFDQIEERLGISRGSVSQGLKTLRQLGAVKLAYQAGSRKDHYIPELSVERLVRGFVKDQIQPHLSSAEERFTHAEDLIASERDPARRAHAQQRLNTLRTWQKRAQKLLPLALTVLAGGRRLAEEAEAGRRVV